MSNVYSTTNELSASFMSKSTFVSWFFSWAARMNIDFRKHVDPFCRYEPKQLACDGTHIGISVRNSCGPFVTDSTEADDVISVHQRHDRMFLPYSLPGHTHNQIMVVRKHLIYHCRKALGKEINLADTPAEEEIPALDQTAIKFFNTVEHGQFRAKTFLTKVVQKLYPPSIRQASAKLLLMLLSEAAVTATVPFRHQQHLADTCHQLQLGQPATKELSEMMAYAPEISVLLREAYVNQEVIDCCDFIMYLISFSHHIHSSDHEVPPPCQMSGTYNPPSGVAYYFTDQGAQVRHLPRFRLKSKTKQNEEVSTTCSKKYPCVIYGGYTNLFLWFCACHGHCYGFHIINGSEGRKDPFCSLFKYMMDVPQDVYYDFACGLQEYCLNRAPQFFKRTRFFHDVFHGFTHKCGPSFKSSRLTGHRINTEICEQFNSFIQCIKYTGTHLSKEHFCFFLQFFIFIWNENKTNYNRQLFSTVSRCQL